MYMTPWVLRLLVANVAVFFLTAAQPMVANLMAFVPALVLQRPWSVLTYMFLHAGFAHLLFNMIGLFFFGPRLEERLGSRDFLVLYFISGIGGALFSFLFEPRAAVVGASGAVYGVLLAFAYYWPRENIYIWGVLPIQARWLALMLVAVSLYSGLSGAQSGVAHFAHLGGLALGFGYLKFRERKKRRKRRPRVEIPLPRSESRSAGKGKAADRWGAIPLEQLHELNREEVESLLRKIESQGVDSLSAEERRFLDRMAGMI
ncbi:MAG: rhomboid family intramembrane serine protease [Gemmatimonadetes bacterium]|nr:rhomboid family intramembrane serine protease [Gemmatimonadota bacterium]NIT87951.1 rhomboid family intramembrane serine protease [Gemmatimonadota bacterium]NIU31802.1 rhomboid family intramembrane serine protease [Gemmatimonadota bacterium]NIV62164.1 rhomboid family intramembrane serine protease [Gemmatimonadota bacterium]NIV83329.1 rhomboid family intramembrane serine protease [Gemmatimonadota bacterium]